MMVLCTICSKSVELAVDALHGFKGRLNKFMRGKSIEYY